MRKAVSTLLVAIILISVMTITVSINHVEAVDGNESTVTLVKDINAGVSDSNPTYFTINEPTSTIYFRADDGIHGNELWKTDGTAKGTVMVKDINPGTASGLHLETLDCASVDQTLFFYADDGIHGNELWKTDGTEAGTMMVKDIWNINELGSNPSSLTRHGSMVYFGANDRTHGYELWKSDGTPAGTVLVKNINTYKDPWMTDYDDGSNPIPFLSYGSFLYFLASDRTNGCELWRTDGTESGTILLKDIVPGANWERQHEQFIKAFGHLIFTVYYPSTGTTELWSTDGTPTGTTLVKSFTSSSDNSIYALNEIGESLLFFADDGTNGYELWKTDGTPPGTALVKDVNPGPENAVEWYVKLELSFDFQNKFGYSFNTLVPQYYSYLDSYSNLYFVADDGTAGYEGATDTWKSEEIWKTDGTPAGTVKVTNLGSGNSFPRPYNPTPIGETLYYFWGWELWKINKPGESPSLVFDFTIPEEISETGFGVSLDVAPDRVFGTELLIVRTRPIMDTPNIWDAYYELWITDGTNAGTRLLLVSWPALGDRAAVMDGALFFNAQARVQNPAESLGSELYKYPNAAPVAVISSSPTGLEGSATTFDASTSTDDVGVVSYDWDWNGDGTYEETTNTPLVDHTWYDDWSGSVKLKVADGYGLTDETSVTVTILNVAPVASIDSIEHPYGNIFVGDTVTFHGSFSDPGVDDTHSTTWNFGDGTLASGVLTPTHVYAANGLFTVILTVTDDDSEVGSHSITLKAITVNEAISDLINTVKNLNIHTGLKSSLLGKLQDANRLLIEGHYHGTAGKLNDFLKQVEAQMGKKLANELAISLISRAQEIIDHV